MIIRPDFNKKDQVKYPSFIRNRLALRAPIRSEKSNLEDHQFSYDVYNINAKQAQLKITMSDYNTSIEGETENDVDTIQHIMTLLANYDKRLKILEEN